MSAGTPHGEGGSSDEMVVALITRVFEGDPDGVELLATLRGAREAGAVLAVLPELPLDRWIPVGREATDRDAEPPGGVRSRRMAVAAREPVTGRRHNTALVYDPVGRLVSSYRKLHLPEEEGFWETSHYEPGEQLAAVVRELPMPCGVQICSDVNRPVATQLLAAGGAEVILVPRATPLETYDRWRLVLRANAVTSGSYVISVNRPAGEGGPPIGGCSLAISPDGNVLLETDEPVRTVVLSRARVREAREGQYPGYLDLHSDLYARGWKDLTGS